MNQQPITLAQNVLGTIQMLVPSSFEKKLAKLEIKNLVIAMNLCLDGLSQEQVDTGLRAVRDMGFCPDPALFRRWCLGHRDFENTDPVADTYIGKHGALAHVCAWIDDQRSPISTTEYQAYCNTSQLFGGIENGFDRSRAHSAFMDEYEHLVKARVAERAPCEPYSAPVALPTVKTTQSTSEHNEADIATVQAHLSSLCKSFGLDNQPVGAVA